MCANVGNSISNRPDHLALPDGAHSFRFRRPKSPPPGTLVFQEKAPIIVSTKIGFSIRANKGGQQPSQSYYPANLRTLYLHMQTTTAAGRLRRGFNCQIAELETRVSYRKQRPATCSNRQRMQKAKLQFSTVDRAFSALPESLRPTKVRPRSGAAQSIIEAHGPRQTSQACVVQFNFGAQ